jgi:UDPglucose--hexose-1-phosphate uridylyltransferase
MKFNNNNPHRRYNILTGEWVLVSPHRTKRPWQGKQETIANSSTPAYDENCYLCPGNTRTSGELNPQYSSVHSFVNDFSALLDNTTETEYNVGLLKAKSEKGICKVICFSPNHSLTLPLMNILEIQNVVDIWQDEYKNLGSIKWINNVQIFENKGAVMGCSNQHPHGQVWAQSSIPQEVVKKSIKQKEYWQKHGHSLLQDYINEEIKNKERIISQNEHFIALVPYWAVWPYEVIIVPKTHHQNIIQLSIIEKKDFAEMIKIVTTKYDNLFQTSFPYSSGIHQAPTDGQDYPEWHFHMAFYPPLLRSASIKKFMVGYEMFANPQRDITAEQAAKKLSQLSVIHYSEWDKV